MPARYSVGDEVQSVRDATEIGTVVEVLPTHADVQYYRVNLGGGRRTVFSEIDLRPYEPEARPADNVAQGNVDGYAEFQRLITYERLRRDAPLRNNVYAFNASRTRFYPYQFKPLVKFLESARHRILIADEVGLGKTIEAGLILTEMRAREDIRRVLVVCPSNLREKWQVELQDRFDEEFDLLRAADMVRYLERYAETGGAHNLNGIVSIESLRRDSVIELFESVMPELDLVIVDEAHHMRNVGTKTNQLGHVLSANADAMLHLTATPVHLGSENLFNLLNILDDEEFQDADSFDELLEANEPVVRTQICMAQIPPNLDDANNYITSIAGSDGFARTPAYMEVCDHIDRLQSPLDDDTRRRTVLDAQRSLAELNLIAHIVTRSKKRDVQPVRAVRRASPLRMQFTDQELRFYRLVTDFVMAESARRVQSPVVRMWMLNTPQRRMASCIPAMVDHFKRNLPETADGADWGYADHYADDDADSSDERVRASYSELRAQLSQLVNAWPANAPDTKYETFTQHLSELAALEKPLKVIVFAFFKGTLEYLQQRLAQDGYQTELISGDVHPFAERRLRIERFRADDRVQILLSSRVGGEGLDFQFCNTLFNYDLPWNPMEVEQRIGRLDRIGQRSPVIRIFNFWIKGTIEERILSRLYDRIGIFESSIGELEMILGDELSTLERDILSKQLTEDEQSELLERKANAIETRKHDLADLERDAARFIGTDQYFEAEVDAIKKRRRYVTAQQMRRFVEDFIRTTCPRTRMQYDAESGSGRLYPDPALRQLVAASSDHPRRHQLLQERSGGIPITFDAERAFEAPELQFLGVLHPLVRVIAEHYGKQRALSSNAHQLRLESETLPPGVYLYFVYRVRVRAVRSYNSLEMIVLDDNLDSACDFATAEALLGEMTELGDDALEGRSLSSEGADRAAVAARTVLSRRLDTLRSDALRYNDAFLRRRMDSLTSTYEKKISSARKRLATSEENKRSEEVIRMNRGTINRLEDEFAVKQKELQKQREITLDHDDVAAGVLEIVVQR